MNHAEHLVDLVDKNGTATGTKQRREIHKATDLYHTILVILGTPDQKLILSKIPDREDLPNLYPGSLGATVATIRRHNETPDEASLRAVKHELFIEGTPLAHLGDTYLELPGEHKKYMSVYSGIHPVPEDFSHNDIESLVILSQAELNDAMQSNKGQFASTFLAIWQKYKREINMRLWHSHS